MTTDVPIERFADTLEVVGDFHPVIAEHFAKKLAEYDPDAMCITDLEKFTIPKKVLIRYKDRWDNRLTFVTSDLRQ